MRVKNKIIIGITISAAVLAGGGIAAYFIVANAAEHKGGSDVKNPTIPTTNVGAPSPNNGLGSQPENQPPTATEQPKEDPRANKIRDFNNRVSSIQAEISGTPINPKTSGWRNIQVASRQLEKITKLSDYMVRKRNLEIESSSADDSLGQIKINLKDPSDETLKSSVTWSYFQSNAIKNSNRNLIKFTPFTNGEQDAIKVEGVTWEKWKLIAESGEDFVPEFYRYFTDYKSDGIVAGASISWSKGELTINVYIPQPSVSSKLLFKNEYFSMLVRKDLVA